MQIRYNRGLEKPNLDVFKVFTGKFILDVSSVQRRCRLEQQDFTLVFRKRPMLDAARNNDELARLDPFAALAVVPIVHTKPTLYDEKHFVFGFVMMPREWPLKFHEFDQLAIEFARDARIPMIANEREFFGEIDF